MEGARSVVVNGGGEQDQIDLIDLPPGFRFHPTDEEIINHYLTLKVINSGFTAAAIGEVDLNKSEPWDLPKKAKMGEKEWYFFCQRDRKYPTGMRTNRATESGYWKATGKDKEIYKQGKSGSLVGMKKTLVFYKGRAPKGEKTNWVMHEFRLEGKFSYYNFAKGSKDEWVVCRVFHKNSCTAGMKRSSPFTDNVMRMNSFVDELLEGPSWLPPLMDPPLPNFEDHRMGNCSSFTNDIDIDHNGVEDKKFKGIAASPYNNDGGDHFQSYISAYEVQLQRDHEFMNKTLLIPPYNYNFNTNTYQLAAPVTYPHQQSAADIDPYLPTGSSGPSLGAIRSILHAGYTKNEAPDGCKVEQSSRISISQDTGVSTDLTTTDVSSSPLPLSKQDTGVSQKSYESYDPDDDHDHGGPGPAHSVAPCALSELDSLWDY